MRQIKLAYRDNDRTPVIFCIQEMARKHYDLEIRVLQIQGTADYEAALFAGSCDVLIEHLEYLFVNAEKRAPVTLFCAPSIRRGAELVVSPRINRLEDLKGETMTVRSSGRPHTIALWLRAMGLEEDVRTVVVKDGEVGRWGQWKKVSSGDSAATFMDPIYLLPALAAGLKVLPVHDIEVVGHFAQACLSRYPAENPELFRDYVKAVIHALCLIKFQRESALEISAGEPMRLMGIQDLAEMSRQFDCIARELQIRPYPTLEALRNSHEVAAVEYGAGELNPLTFWDLHWIKELDDEGFIDALIKKLRA